MTEQAKMTGRLAMRQEGTLWNAYYALPNTMEGAIYLGGIAMALVVGDGAKIRRKDAFLRLMSDAVADLLKDATGTKPTMKGPIAAPESERGGHA